MTYQSASREFWRISAVEMADRSAAGASAAGELIGFHEGLIREIEFRILRYLYKREDPEENLWPSSGEEPEQLTPPPPLLRGGGRSCDSDADPRGPKIVAHEVLTGPRVVLKRLEKATEEGSEKAVDVEMVSDDSAPRSTNLEDVVDSYDDSSEEERARLEPGPSKPLKRARGRPRKDGSGLLLSIQASYSVH